jgi:hypothetical protein
MKKYLKKELVDTPHVDYINVIHSGDLLAWSNANGTRLSRLIKSIIRLLTMSEYSHVGIAFCMDNEVYVLEALEPSIKLTLLRTVPGFYHIPMNIEWQPEYSRILADYICKSYSILDAIRGFFGKTDTSNDRWQCAELANDFYRRIGLDFGDAYTPGLLIKAILMQTDTTINYKS